MSLPSVPVRPAATGFVHQARRGRSRSASRPHYDLLVSHPVIAVTMGHPPKGQPGAQLNATYIHAVQKAGGTPLLLPPQVSSEALAGLLAVARAVVLTGGGDVDPARYGEARHPAVAGVSQERDALELQVIRFALDRELPLLAICRGVQILNVARGGTLVQDIPTQFPTAVAHAVPEPRDAPSHEVIIKPGSHLAGLVGAETLGVNSRHHQAVNRAGEGLVPVAWADGGLVEAVEMPGRWVVGVQWHPENMVDASPAALALFAGVVRAAATGR